MITGHSLVPFPRTILTTDRLCTRRLNMISTMLERHYTLKQEISAEEIFAEFIFADLPLIRKIIFLKFIKNGRSAKINSANIFVQQLKTYTKLQNRKWVVGDNEKNSISVNVKCLLRPLIRVN